MIEGLIRRGDVSSNAELAYDTTSGLSGCTWALDMCALSSRYVDERVLSTKSYTMTGFKIPSLSTLIRPLLLLTG